MVKRRGSERAVQQINGRERETATFLFSLHVKFYVACNRFRATSFQPLGIYPLNL